jgi:spermidine synthase
MTVFDANKKWFQELIPLLPGQEFSLEMDEILHHQRSKYQDVLVFKK